MAGTGTAHLRDSDDVLLRVENLVVEFPVGRTGLKVNAVSGISFDVIRGETLGLVGESGCGKSTTGRAIMQLPRPTSGSVRFEGNELTALAGDPMAMARAMALATEAGRTAFRSGRLPVRAEASPSSPTQGRVGA